MIKLRHEQPTVWEGLFAEEVAELWEPWMRVVDQVLEDEELVDVVYDAQGRRHPQSRVRGRRQTPGRRRGSSPRPRHGSYTYPLSPGAV